MDSYDKLKPYGIAINGCIDGFSRFVLWMEAYNTNSDPKVISDYHISTVTRIGGCPERLRADLGTENGHVKAMQVFLCRNHTDSYAGEKSFMYGCSTANQRIEAWWVVNKVDNFGWTSFRPSKTMGISLVISWTKILYNSAS